MTILGDLAGLMDDTHIDGYWLENIDGCHREKIDQGRGLPKLDGWRIYVADSHLDIAYDSGGYWSVKERSGDVDMTIKTRGKLRLILLLLEAKVEGVV